MPYAMLIIDVQQVLCSGRYAVFEADRVIDRINQLSRRARAAKVPVIVIQHESDDGVLIHGSDGWQLAPGLEVDPDDIRLRKRATDSFHQTELQAMLQRLGTTELIVCGMQSEFCVDTTVRRALALGYPVTLVADGHSTIANGVLSAAQISAHHTETLCNIESFGPRARAVNAGEVCLEGRVAAER